MAPTFTKVLVSCFLLASSVFLLPGCDAQKTIDRYNAENKWEQDKRNKRVNERYSSLNALIGLSKHDLILKNGPPDQTSSDGAGGEVLTYAKSLTYGTFIYGMYVQNTNLKYIEIFCDPTGKIYTWRAN